MNVQLLDLIVVSFGLGLLLLSVRGLLAGSRIAMFAGPQTSAPRPSLANFFRIQSRNIQTRSAEGDEGAARHDAPTPEPSVQRLATEISSLREIVQRLAKEIRTIRESLNRPRAHRN